MTVEYIRYEIPSGQQADFIDAYVAAKTPLMSSDYAVSYDICQCDEDPSQFILRI